MEARAVARAAAAGLAPEPYRGLVRAQIAAARAVQEAADTAAPVATLLGTIRTANDRLDAALLPALVEALPITTLAEVVVAAIRRDAPVPGLSETVVRPLADALRAQRRESGAARTPLRGLSVSAKLPLHGGRSA